MQWTKLIVVFLIAGMRSAAFAGDDPSIQGPTRVGIQEAMKAHIGHNTVKDQYVIYDAVKGELKRLALKKLHEGIVKKGEFYVSCADFLDAQGSKYDIDFLVVQKGYNFHVLQALVHKIGDDKRKYHVEDAG